MRKLIISTEINIHIDKIRTISREKGKLSNINTKK